MNSISLAVLFLAACGEDAAGRWIEVSSEIAGVERLTVTVLDPGAALVVEEPLPEDDQAVDLPDRFLLDARGRTGPARVLVWGLAGDDRVAFGAIGLDLGDGGDVAVALAAPPIDCDGDAIPDDEDGCPESPDPEQLDPDGDGITAGCDATRCSDNTVDDAGFEVSTAGWVAVNGALTQTTSGRGRSSHAARACHTDFGESYVNLKLPEAVEAPAAGTQIRASAFVRAAPDEPIPEQVHGILQIERDAGDRQAQGASVVPGECWQLVVVETTVTETDALVVALSFPGDDDGGLGACFDLDDVCLEVTP